MKVIWRIRYHEMPHVIRYCKQCGKKTEFFCSNLFRVNAQRRYLDIWLIYKCVNCDMTWNAEVYSRISPQTLPGELLERFYCNEKALAEEYAMNMEFLKRNGAEVLLPEYSVEGSVFSAEEETELEILNEYALPVKVSAVVRRKLGLSQKAYLKLISEEQIRSVPEQDLKKCRVNDRIVILFKKICQKKLDLE